MLKANLGYSDSQQSTVLAFGLEDANLEKLQEGKEIAFKGEDVEVRGADFAIFYTQSKEKLQEDVSGLLQGLIDDDSEISVMHMDNSFYLLVLDSGERSLYIVGLDDISYEKLKADEALTFRARTDDPRRESITATILWGRDVEHIKNKLR